jgi:hypothetical protein
VKNLNKKNPSRRRGFKNLRRQARTTEIKKIRNKFLKNNLKIKYKF